MKLLSVNMTLDPVSGGGSAARTLQATRALADLGVECAIVTSEEGIDARVQSLLRGVTLVTLPVTAGRFRLPYGGMNALAAAIAQADVVLLLNHWTAINVFAWRAVKALRKPYVVCPAGALPLEGGRSRTLKRIYNMLFGRAIIGGADAHIAVTADETSQFRAYGIDPARVTVIPNGMPEVPASDGAVFRETHGLGDAPLLMFLGRLAPIKGPDLLVAAFARCAQARAEWHLVLAGPDDGMMGALKAQAAALGVAERVHFVGFLDETTKPQALAAADLVVVPSRREAMSIVVLEAAGAGRPVLITDQCGVPDVAESAGGWVVAATEDALADGILEATRDRSELAGRGVAWREAATARYSWARVGQRYIDLLTSVRAGRRG